MPKQIYTWSKVTAGDIISFRYKGKKAQTGKLTTLLVMNPKFPIVRKDNTKGFHLIGLKLEERGTIPTIRNKTRLVELLEKLGGVSVVDANDQIYRVIFENTGTRGVRKQFYTKVKNLIEQYGVYRTYDYEEARKSQVFLEPIVLPKDFREELGAD